LQSPADLAARLNRASAAAARLKERLCGIHLGAPELVERLIAALLAGGHVLLEGPPGVGKTRLLRALAGSLDLRFRRVQGTPDLMPGDLTGGDVLEESAGRRGFRFEPGPLFTQVLLFDEINRATPRTQAALLEAMAEQQVSVGNTTHPLPQPFFVAATQNPIELEGTYPLPEAQLDRFLFLLRVPLPELDSLRALLRGEAGDPAPAGGALMDAATLADARALAAQVPVADSLINALAELVLATHPAAATAPDEVRESVAWGISPRGGQAALAGARALALVRGRIHVTPQDLRDAVLDAFRHRLFLRYEAQAAGATSDVILKSLLDRARLR
jgi:MoxR-like ATPase